MAHPFGKRDLVEQTASKEPMTLDSFGGRIHVRWSPDEAVTPLGQLPFSSETSQSGHFEEWRSAVTRCRHGDLAGGRRYAHVNMMDQSAAAGDEQGMQ